MSLYICTLAEMKAELGLTDTTDDAVLTRWMNGMQGRFDAHLQRNLLRQVGCVETFNGGESFIYLTSFPVEAIAQVNVSPVQDWGDGTKLDAGQFVFDARRGLVAYNPSSISMVQIFSTAYAAGNYQTPWPAGFQNVRVTYTGGFVACDGTVSAGQFAMPEDIRRAFTMQLGFEWRNRLNLGKNNVSMTGQSVNIAPAKFLPDVLETLAPHRRLIA